MIRLGLRLAVTGGREALTRFAAIAVAVTLGVGLLLAALAGINAVNAQNARYAWLNTGIASSPANAAPAAPSPIPATVDPAWWLVRGDHFDGRTIGRVDVAATGARSPVPPGIPSLPGPGQFYASPEMSKLLASTPAAQLGDRYPGTQIGVIGSAGLPSPDSFIIIVGHAPDQLSRQPDAKRVTSILTIDPSDCLRCAVGTPAAGMDLILSVVAAALLFPVLVFIGAATRLAAARREARFAAMRLIGATPGQTSTIAAVESTAAAIIGVAAGFDLFFLLRRPIAAIPFTGMPFYPSDLSLNIVDIALVAVGVPIGAATAAWIALRQVRISPLGVTRRVTPRAPRAYRLILLLAGVGELAYFIGRRPETSDGQAAAFLPGILMIMAGLVVAGPWLTMVVARALARRARGPAALIAARRLADDPKAAFRAVSGLVLGLFVTSVAVGVITTIVANRGADPKDRLAATTLSLVFGPDRKDQPAAATLDATLAHLRVTPGVTSATMVRDNPDQSMVSVEIVTRDNSARPIEALPGLVSCADLAATPVFGRCEAGAEVAEVWDDLIGYHSMHGPGTVWPTAAVSADQLPGLPVDAIVVGTDGSTATIERARTVLETAYPNERVPPATRADFDTDFTKSLVGWRQLANVVILATLPIAGCGLAVSVAGGLSERKRPFSLLRLSGAPLGVLRRVVALESAAPLLVVAAVAVGVGLLAAQLFLRAQMDYTLRPPGAGYYLLVIAGLAASLGIIASTLPLLERMTGPETARND